VQVPFHVGVSGTALERHRATGAGASEGEDLEILRTGVYREADFSVMSGVDRSLGVRAQVRMVLQLACACRYLRINPC
jgi:hypothetical protein